VIELRSDTFTKPTGEMRRAMADAPLGDDVYREDPTVRSLEELAAETLGKEAACLMPSGTMANLASLMVHAPRGAKVLVGSESDIYVYEAGGASVCGGVVYEPIPTRPDGRLLLEDLAAGFPIDDHDPQFARPALICVENTQNRCGGVVLPEEYLEGLRRFAHERGVAVHLDGARVFNAAVASGVPVSRLATHADSLQFCLSKGLGAPVGSVVLGRADFVAEVRRVRKMLGGGMRQAGVIAAAGIVAIKNVERLAEDHENAVVLAGGLAGIPGIEINPAEVKTNICMFRVTDTRFTWRSLVASAWDLGVAIGGLGHGRIRAVTHSGVTRQDIDAAVSILAKAVRQGPDYRTGH
jgi:threonine aldolase